MADEPTPMPGLQLAVERAQNYVAQLRGHLDEIRARLAQADTVIAQMDALIRSGCLAGCGSNGKVVADAVAEYVGEAK